jgi:spore coat polysaccharide biosynthesis protein SpsF
MHGMIDAIVLQARIRSTRLPGKLLLPLCGKTIFEHILARLLAACAPDAVMVATTPSTEPRIAAAAASHGVPIHVGSEEDVLGRYAEAVSRWELRNVVRATGDNPLVSIEYIDMSLKLHRESGADLTVYPDLPYGTGVEVIRGDSLLLASASAQDPFEREHVTQYIYRHEDRFRVLRGVPEPFFCRPELRLTVDTEEDYRRMERIYGALYRGRPIGLGEVIAYLDSGGA